MGREKRLAVLIVVLAAGVLLLAGLCVQQCEAREVAWKQVKSRVGLEFDEDLSFLDEEENHAVEEETKNGSIGADGADSFEDEEGAGEVDEEIREFDEKDVVVLGSGNFSDFVKSNLYVLVNFYVPWCGYCRAFAPEYADAATVLEGGEAMLAKVDATVNDKLAQEYGVESYPTLFFFIDGVHRPYPGQLLKDEIVAWVKKRTRPTVFSLHSREVAKTILYFQKGTMAISLLNSLEGSEAEEYASAARQVGDIFFFQTNCAEAAEVFNFPRDINRPALLLVTEADEKVSWFDGQFKRDAIEDFVTTYKCPLVTTFNKQNAGLIFDSPIKKQVILFAGNDDYERLILGFKESARALLGNLVFVHVDLDDHKQAPGICEFFGISGGKPVVMGYEAEENGRKFLLEGEITVENVKVFGEKFLSNNLKARLMSEPVPQMNDGDVRIVVGLSLDAIALDETKDVFLEIYAPWCGHCQRLQPAWDKLGKRLRGVESIVIAKMDGTKNEHERAEADGYPTLLFFPAGKKNSDPGERTVKGFVKFLKKEAAIAFKVPRITHTQNTGDTGHAVQCSIGSRCTNKSRQPAGYSEERMTKAHLKVFAKDLVDTLKDEL